MESLKQRFIQDSEIAVYVMTKMDNETKLDILSKYSIIADIILKTSDDSMVINNKENYSILLNRVLFIALLTTHESLLIDRFKSIYNVLTVIDNKLNNGTRTSKSYEELYKNMVSTVSKLGVTNISKNINIEDINKSLITFGLEEATDIDDSEVIEDNDIDIDFDGLFDEDDDLADDFKMEDSIEEDSLEQDSVEDIVEEENIEKEEKNTQDLKAELQNLFEEEVNKAITELLITYRKLYKSGYEAMPQPGILVKAQEPYGAIWYAGGDGKLHDRKDKGTISDIKIYNTIAKFLPELSLYSADEVPNIKTLINGNKCIFHKFQVQLQSANVKYCKGLSSIRKWITENRLKGQYENSDEWLKQENKGTVRLQKYKDVESWTKWTLENIFYNALIEMDIQPSYNDITKATSIIDILYKSLKNVIVVSEREIGVNTEIRISTDTYIDIEGLKRSLENTLNVGNSTSISVKQIGEYKNNVLILRIVFNEEKANKANLFAYEVLDNIISSGNPPSWSHALLGKKEDGTYLFWDDFMDPKKAAPNKRCYTIYAASRSGKGIMTSTLVASALCDQKQVFYTDGKPENGACLGEMAWSKGHEAYVFNGTAEGSVPYSGSLEQWTNGMRTEDEVFEYGRALPKCLFESQEWTQAKQQSFLGVMRYLKSLYLCAKNINERARGTVNKDNWQIWIFDEMTKMSELEADIRKLFYDYLNKNEIKTPNKKHATKGVCAVSPPSDSKNVAALTNSESEKYDAGVDYIVKWLKWTNQIVSYVLDAAKISLGKADVNLIFIFQEASWIFQDSEITTLGRVVSMLSSTKIVGNKGISPACRDYGDDIITNKPWAKKINSGTGWWAISSQASIAKDENVTLFKPFNVYTTKLGAGDVKSTEPFKNEEESLMYMDGYARKLLSSFGTTPEEVLQQSYDYADNFVRNQGLHAGLKQYIYDVTNLDTSDGDNSLENLGANVVEAFSDTPDFNTEDDFDELEEQEGQEEQGEFEDNDIIDFGTPLDNDSEGPEEEIIDFGDSFESQVINNLKDDETIKNLKFLNTKTLMDKNYNNHVLDEYFNKFIYQRVLKNTFNYSDRDRKSNNGLLAAVVILSNCYYCCCIRNIYNIQNITDTMKNIIAEQPSLANNYKLAIGILKAYDESELMFDTLPTVEQLRNYLQQAEDYNQYGYTSEMDDVNNFTDFTDDENMIPVGDESEYSNFNSSDYTDNFNTTFENQVNEDIPVDKPSYQFDTNGNIQFNPRQSQEILIMQPDMYTDAVAPKYHTVERFKKRLFESANGTSYEFKKRWDMVLAAVLKLFPNATMVTRFAIAGTQLTVNGKVIRLDGMLGGPYDIRLEDIVQIRETFKKFPMIQYLILDYTATQKAMLEYGEDSHGIWKMFQENKALQTIGLISAMDNKPTNYYRKNFAQTANQLDKQLGVEQFKMKMEQMSASKNNHLHNKNPGYLHGVFQRSKSFSGKAFGNAGKAIMDDKHPKVIKALGFSVLGVVTIGVGSLLGIGGKLASMIRH